MGGAERAEERDGEGFEILRREDEEKFSESERVCKILKTCWEVGGGRGELCGGWRVKGRLETTRGSWVREIFLFIVHTFLF